jgi:hypothetical protein
VHYQLENNGCWQVKPGVCISLIATESTEGNKNVIKSGYCIFPCFSVAIISTIIRFKQYWPGYLTGRCWQIIFRCRSLSNGELSANRVYRGVPIPSPAVSHASVPAMYRGVQVPREAGEGETAQRSRDWPGPGRGQPVHSSCRHSDRFHSRMVSGYASPAPASWSPVR